MNLIHVSCDWETFYSGYSNVKYNEIKNENPKNILITNGSSYYFLECYFRDITTDSALKFTANTAQTLSLIEKSIFYNCSSKSDGGSIYYNNGEMVVNKGCFFHSISGGRGQVMRSYVSSLENKKNYLIMTSFNYCGKSDKNYPIDNYYGQSDTENGNFTNNCAIQNAGVNIENLHSSCTLKYSSFYNCSQSTSKQACMIHYCYWNTQILLNISYCNIIRNGNNNYQKIKYQGIFDLNKMKTEVYKCIIKENYILSLVYLHDCSVVVKSSFCDNERKAGSGSLTFVDKQSQGNDLKLLRIFNEKCKFYIEISEIYNNCSFHFNICFLMLPEII